MNRRQIRSREPLVRQLFARQDAIPLTTKELSARSGYEASYISHLRRNPKTIPSVPCLIALGHAVGLTLTFQETPNAEEQ